MAESVFEIFGNHVSKPKDNNYGAVNKFKIGGNVENFEKVFPTGNNTESLKPQEVSLKKSEFGSKKSFLNNKGASFQVTPFKSLTPRSVKRQPLLEKAPLKIYSDTGSTPEKTPTVEKEIDYLTEIEFTKPRVIYNNYDKDIFDDAFYMDSDIDPFLLSMPGCSTPLAKEAAVMTESDAAIMAEYEAAAMIEYEDIDDEFLRIDEILNEDIHVDDLDLPPMY